MKRVSGKFPDDANSEFIGEKYMKEFNMLLAILLLVLVCTVSPTTINGRFTNVLVEGTKMSVLLQINTNSGADDLGGTTMVISFDTIAVSFPDFPANQTDYIFHDFSDGNYSIATLTKPLNNQIWINIDLPYINSNIGTIVAADPEWTDVVTIIFDIVDQSHSSNLVWLTTSPFWGIYDADNSTLWQTGDFEDLPTSVESEGGELLTNYELSQNYPNPFNPSTKIKFRIPSTINNSVAVSLKIFDILGNEVATLVDEEKMSGVYEVEFSSFDGSASLASGIYIYSLKSGNFMDSKKMILLK